MKKKFKCFKVFTKNSKALQDFNNLDYYEYSFSDPSKYNTEKLTSIIDVFLKKINREDISPFVGICMGEIVSNSIKANLKRAHFILNNLDINNTKDYEIGMQTFHDEGLCLLKNKSTAKKIDKMNLYVKVILSINNNQFKIITINNCAITPEEQERIYAKLKLSEDTESEDLFPESVDTTEGSGLGIIMIQRLMSQMGLPRESFTIYAKGNETFTELLI